MSNTFINIDQKSRPQWKQGRIRKAIGGVILVSLFFATGLQAKDAVAHDLNVSKIDYLLSPDMVEFIHVYGRGADISEQDMD
jgi:hypothetical protein